MNKKVERFSEQVWSQREIADLEALLNCFNEQGCFRTKVDLVVAEVGIGKGTLYRHYPSRQDLYKAALRMGIDALRVRCQSVWETSGTDPEVGFRAVITELVSLNHSREKVSPATLARLGCGCGWMSERGPDDGCLEAMLVPLVRTWQAVRLFHAAADPSLIAAVILALVNSPAVIDHIGGEPVEASEAIQSPRSSAQMRDIAGRLVELLRRAFPLVSGSVSTVEAPHISAVETISQ